MSITIYTNYLVVSYDISFPGSKEDLAHALDEGPVYVDVIDTDTKKITGSILINSINAVLIEIKDTPILKNSIVSNEPRVSYFSDRFGHVRGV